MDTLQVSVGEYVPENIRDTPDKMPPFDWRSTFEILGKRYGDMNVTVRENGRKKLEDERLVLDIGFEGIGGPIQRHILEIRFDDFLRNVYPSIPVRAVKWQSDGE